ncbi:MAG: hypothetical protein ACTSQI_11555 [Candidatus Helarchaeota archaeon]
MLRTKHRFLILLTISLAFASGFLVNQIAVYLNINPTDPLYFNELNTAFFQYNDGFLANRTLTLNVVDLQPTWTNTSVTIESTQWIAMTPEGFVNGTDRYSIFWVHIPNPLIAGPFGVPVGRVFNMTDPIGLLGDPGVNYTGIVTDKLVYWPLTSGIHGAQFSFTITFYNATNNAIIAQGLYDSTCGLLFELKGGSPYVQMYLLETSYPISRNRMVFGPSALILSAGITVIAYIFMKKKTALDSATITEITLLMSAGVAVLNVDIIVDVWFYALLGFMGNILLHIGVALGLIAICFYQRYKIKWTIPAFLEIAFLIPMVFFMGDPYVPLMTASMGLVITWLGMIYVSGHPKQPESQTTIGKIISEFV